MNFGPWLSLAAVLEDGAELLAPAHPGLLELRAAAVLSYPRGKSAMVFYAATRADEDLRAYCLGRGRADLVAASAQATWIRFGLTDAPVSQGERRLRLFVERFGMPPLANRAVAAPSA